MRSFVLTVGLALSLSLAARAARFSLGEADKEARIAATDETLYPAASVSKILTAALVMREVERGRLSLDAPVNESLPPERQVCDAAGILDPSVSYLEWLANARVYDSPNGLLVETPLNREPARFIPTGDHAWVVSGRSMFEGAHALSDGDRLYVGFVESGRISVLRSARALYVYGAVLLVALVGAIVWLGVRWWRGRRRPSRAL